MNTYMNQDLLSNVTSYEYQNNYMNCLCSRCLNCYVYDAPKYHTLYDKCIEIRPCLNCNNMKFNNNRSYIKNILIRLYLFIFQILLSPIVFISYTLYHIHYIGQNIINISYPEFTYNSYYELQSYVNLSDNKLSIDYGDLLKLNIICKILYIIKYFIFTSYRHLYSNVLYQESIFMTCLLFFFLYYNFTFYIIIIICICIYDMRILTNIFYIILLTFINTPRVIITAISCMCAYLAIIINNFIENILINKCAWPFLKLNDNYNIYGNKLHKILSPQIDIFHAIYRLILLLPVFIYYLMYCIMNSLLIIIFGQEYEFRSTYIIGELYESENRIFYPEDYRGTIFQRLCFKIRDTCINIFTIIYGYIMIKYRRIIQYIDYMIDYMIKKYNYMMYILFYNILNK